MEDPKYWRRVPQPRMAEQAGFEPAERISRRYRSAHRPPAPDSDGSKSLMWTSRCLPLAYCSVWMPNQNCAGAVLQQPRSQTARSQFYGRGFLDYKEIPHAHFESGWRAVPDSNRLPSAVLADVLPKALPARIARPSGRVF